MRRAACHAVPVQKTGRALRSMDRGIRSANTVVNFLFLRIGPTILEWLVMVCIFIFNVRGRMPWSAVGAPCVTVCSPFVAWSHVQFKSPLAGLVAFVSFVVYFAATLLMTRWRKKIRKRMNEQVGGGRGVQRSLLCSPAKSTAP